MLPVEANSSAKCIIDVLSYPYFRYYFKDNGPNRHHFLYKMLLPLMRPQLNNQRGQVYLAEVIRIGFPVEVYRLTDLRTYSQHQDITPFRKEGSSHKNRATFRHS